MSRSSRRAGGNSLLSRLGRVAQTTLHALLAVAGLTAMAVPVARIPDRTLVAPPAKTIAITFDDLPRGNGAFYTKRERAARLLAALRRARVRQAAFFVNPSRINLRDGDADRIAAYVAAGHVMADHTFLHHDLSSMSATDFLADIDKAEGWLKGRPGYRPWFRFPGLNQGGRNTAKRDTVLAGLAQRGLMVAPVTVDGIDWHLERLASDARLAGKPMDFSALRDLYVETMVQAANFADGEMRRIIGRSPAHILLLHDTDLAAAYIGPLIAALDADGWRIVTADAAFADPIYHARVDGPASNGTLVEALGSARGVTGRLWYDRTDLKTADALFAARVLHAGPDAAQLAMAAAPHRETPRRRSWRRHASLAGLQRAAHRAGIPV